MAGVEPINLRVTANANGLKAELGSAQNYVRTFGQQIAGQNRQIASSIGSLRTTLAGLASIPALIGGSSLGFGLKLAADAEVMELRFQTLTGSAIEAQRVLKEITEFSASTPFELPEVQNAAAQLISAKFEGEKLGEELRALGNIAAATGTSFDELANLVAKAKRGNLVFTEDLNQLGDRGINITRELAKQFGVMEEDIRKLASSGKISFADLNQALLNLGLNEYAGATERLAQSLSGRLSTLKDDVTQLAKQIGEAFLPTARRAVEVVSSWVQILKDADATTIRATAQNAALVATFAATLAIIPRLVVAIRSIVLALKTLAQSLVTTQALAGPKGWATLAASLIVAAGATYELNEMFREMNAQADAAQAAASDAANKAGDAATNAQDAVAAAATAANARLEEQRRLLDDIAKIGIPRAILRNSQADLEFVFREQLRVGGNNIRNDARVLQDSVAILRDIRNELRIANNAPPIQVT